MGYVFIPAIIFKYFFRALVYSPFILSGFLTSGLFLHRKDNAVIWLGMALLIAYFFHFLIILLKDAIANWRRQRKVIWMPLYIMCVAYTCVLPAYIIFGPVEKIMSSLNHQMNAELFSWIVSVGFGFYLFRRHGFLKNN
jgi:uncharacterized membrane protein YczE